MKLLYKLSGYCKSNLIDKILFLQRTAMKPKDLIGG